MVVSKRFIRILVLLVLRLDRFVSKEYGMKHLSLVVVRNW